MSFRWMWGRVCASRLALARHKLDCIEWKLSCQNFPKTALNLPFSSVDGNELIKFLRKTTFTERHQLMHRVVKVPACTSRHTISLIDHAIAERQI